MFMTECDYILGVTLQSSNQLKASTNFVLHLEKTKTSGFLTEGKSNYEIDRSVRVSEFQWRCYLKMRLERAFWLPMRKGERAALAWEDALAAALRTEDDRKIDRAAAAAVAILMRVCEVEVFWFVAMNGFELLGQKDAKTLQHRF